MSPRCRPNAATARQADPAKRRLTALRAALAAAALGLVAAPASAADTVRISGLSDVAFGSISSFSTDAVNAQDVCLYAKNPPQNAYRITASGSGAGGAFTLSSGTATLPFEVQWSDRAGQTVGTQLVANQPLTAQNSSIGAGSADDCSSGVAATASLILILRSAAVAAASSGDYSGSLTLLVAPE